MNIDHARSALLASKAIQAEADQLEFAPTEASPPRRQLVLLTSVVRGTRGSIEKVVYQLNGCYEIGCFDACAVMIRRLVETLIIETFEAHRIEANIKSPDGNYMHLADLIDRLQSCPSWTLSRNTKKALPKLKGIGDQSAHNRYYLAHRGDIDRIAPDLRVIVQERVHISRLKN